MGACACLSRLLTYLGDAGWKEQGRFHAEPKQNLVEVWRCLVSWSDEVVRVVDCLAVTGHGQAGKLIKLRLRLHVFSLK